LTLRSANPAVGPAVSVGLWIGGSLATTWSATRPAAQPGEDERSVLTPLDAFHVAAAGGASAVELRATGAYDTWLDGLARIYS
jgi:hypothetical protein